MSRLPHTWCNVHEVRAPRLDEVPDENADVFAAVCASEESRIKQLNLNLQGQTVMNETETTTVAQALAAAGVTHTRNTYGDPMDIVGKHLPDVSADYYARITNSLAWRMDTAVINAARSILFSLYSEDEIRPDETPAEHFRNFCLEIHDVLRRESLWEANEACAEALVLNRVRLDWHDMAQGAAHTNDRDYNPKSLSEMLVEEKPMRMRVETRANLEVLAARQAKGDERKFKDLMERFTARDTLLAEARVSDNRRLIPVIEEIIDQITVHTPVNGRFDQLEKKTQRSLVDFTMQSLERIAEQDISRDRKVSAQLFGRILDAQDSSIAELKAFRDAHCSDAVDLENVRSQASIEHERRQKEVAKADTGEASGEPTVVAKPKHMKAKA